MQTLRGADDLRSARTALLARIISLARAHDLLTERSWSGADLAHGDGAGEGAVCGRSDRFCGYRAGDFPKRALALSRALHELATNAAKYGALSSPSGRVELRWRTEAGMLHLAWRESGGPAVTPPTRRGFGSRLLEDGLLCGLGGDTRLDYAADGVRCEISALL